jgi:ankyrin repeat protein
MNINQKLSILKDSYNYCDIDGLSKNLNDLGSRIGFEKWLIQRFSPTNALDKDFKWHSQVIALLCTKTHGGSSPAKEKEDLLIANLVAKSDPVKQSQQGRLATIARLVHHSSGMALNLPLISSALKDDLCMPHTHTVLLKRLLRYQTMDALFHQAWNDNHLPLLNVIHNHSPKEFATLVQRRVQEIQDKKCTTPLHLAAQSNHLALTKALLAAAPAIALIQDDIHESTALHFAAEKGFAKIAELLIQAAPSSARVQNKYMSTPLHYAALYNHLDTVKLLLRAAPHTALMQNQHGATALHFAAKKGFAEIAGLLVQTAPGSARLKTKNTLTPLHSAALHNHFDIVKLLLKAAPKTAYIQSGQGMTALHLAAVKGFVEIAQFIAEKAPDTLNLWDKAGDRAYTLTKMWRPENYKKITQLYHNQSQESKELDTVLVQRRLLGHAWEIKGQSVVIKSQTKILVHSINLEGHASPQWYQLMKKHLNMMETDALFNKEQSSLIKHMFDLGANPNSYSIEDQIQRIEAGLPTIISSGYSNHAVTLLVWKDMFVICNRGGASRKPIEIFHLGKKINVAVLEELQKVKSLGTEEDYKNLMFHKLSAGLQFSHSDLDHILEQFNLLPTQIVGNCSFISPTTAIYAFLLLSEVFGVDESGALKNKLSQKNVDELNQNAEKAVKTYQAWLSDLQMNILETNLQKSDTYELDHQLILRALRKAVLLPLSDALNAKLEKLTSNYLNSLDGSQHALVSADLSFWKHIKQARALLELFQNI